MPIRQPKKTTIHSGDFQNHSFSFPVESVLKPQQGVGQLVIRASAGYLLTTSPEREPTPEQTLDHVLQADGNRVARGTVTLLANENVPTHSTVTIENPSGETVILTVDAAPQTALSPQTPTLRVSTQALDFPRTAPGKPAFLVFSVAQQNAETPVTLTTDAPDYFQLASDERPSFTPSLTLTPPPTGAYIHVRYLPGRSGRTEARLTLETPYTNAVVDLTGRSTGWRPVSRSNRAVQPRKPANRPVSSTRMLWLIQLAIGVLAFTGYQYRCELMPSLCQTMNAPAVTPPERPVAPPPAAEVTVAEPEPGLAPSVGSLSGKSVSAKKPVKKAADLEGTSTTLPETRTPDALLPDKAADPAPVPATSTTTLRNQPRRSLRQPTDSQYAGPRRPVIPAAPAGESDLEQELNKKPKNQP